MDRPLMDVNRVVSLSGIPDEQILNIYLAGSRVFGSATDDSDWDFIIVVENSAESLLKEGRHKGEGRAQSEGEFDATIYTENAFKTLLPHHLPLMTCMYLPKESIWREKIDFRSSFVIDLHALRTAVSTIASQGFGYAKICFEKNNDYKKGKKNIVHSMRNTLYGIQMARDGRISDLQCSRDLFYQVMNEDATDWKFFQEKYGAIGKEIHAQFSALVPPKELTAKAKERKIKLKEKTQEKRRKQHQMRSETQSQPPVDQI